jgi:hypothetical protein
MARPAELLELRVPEEHGLFRLGWSPPDGVLEHVPHPFRPARPVPLDELGQVDRPDRLRVRVLERLDAPLVDPERILEPVVRPEKRGACLSTSSGAARPRSCILSYNTASLESRSPCACVWSA